tara:strand:- start:271 stop:1134 length:864 start_codon:yes stop_codon:yes gene_type:complete
MDIQIDPFNAYSPIQKEPLFSKANDLQSSAYSVQLQKYNKDNVPYWDEVGTVGKEYLLVPNSEVNDLALNLTDSSRYVWDKDKLFFDGRRYFQSFTTKTLTKEVKAGDDIGLGLAFQNSYDGSSAFSVTFFGMRLVCKNGLLSRLNLQSFKFRHDKNMEGFQDEIMSAVDFINNSDVPLERFVSGLRNMTEVPFDVNTLHEIRKKSFPTLPVTTFGKCVDKFLDEYDPHSFAQGHTNLWDFYNACTNVLWHEKKITNAHFVQNSQITDSLLRYASEYTGEQFSPVTN